MSEGVAPAVALASELAEAASAGAEDLCGAGVAGDLLDGFAACALVAFAAGDDPADSEAAGVDGAVTAGAGASSTVAAAGLGAGGRGAPGLGALAALGVAGSGAGPVAFGKASLALRTTGASSVEDGPLTYSPSS